MPFDRSARLDALARHLPFGVDDFDAARDTFVMWRRTGAETDRKTALLWAYCYIVWYFYGKFSRERVGNASDLDGVVERACRRVLRSMESVRDPERFPQFVSVVCRNVLLTYRSRRRPTVEMEDHFVPVAASEADGLDRVLVRRLIVRAIDALPPALSEVARMRLLEGRSYQDVAHATGHPLATTRTYYSKAIARLRADPDLRALHADGPLDDVGEDPGNASEGAVRSARS